MANATTTLVPVEFHGDIIYATSQADALMVPISPICAALGIDPQAQARRIRRHPVLSQGVAMMATPSAGGTQNSLAIPLDMLNGWLFGVDATRVKPELRERLTEYQRECFAVLAAHFGATKPAPIPAQAPYAVLPGQTLSAEQADELRSAMLSAAQRIPAEKRGAFMTRGWSRLKAHFGVPYRQIQAGQFDDALGIVSRHLLESTQAVTNRWLTEIGADGQPLVTPVPAGAEVLSFDAMLERLASADAPIDKLAKLAAASSAILFKRALAVKPSGIVEDVERGLISGAISSADARRLAIAAASRMMDEVNSLGQSI